jgi:hypothetical protein
MQQQATINPLITLDFPYWRNARQPPETNYSLSLNQRVQGSSPCAPTKLKSQKKLHRCVEQFLCRMALGSAPGKHFLQNQIGVRVHDEAIQAKIRMARVVDIGCRRLTLGCKPRPPILRPSDTQSRRRPRSACLVDHAAIAYVSGTGGVKSRPPLFRFCTKKITRFVATALIWNLT